MLRHSLHFTFVHLEVEAARPVLQSVPVWSESLRCGDSLCSHLLILCLDTRQKFRVALLHSHSPDAVDQKAVKASGSFCSGGSLQVGEQAERYGWVVLKMGVFKEKAVSEFPENTGSSHQLSQHHLNVNVAMPSAGLPLLQGWDKAAKRVLLSHWTL